MSDLLESARLPRTLPISKGSRIMKSLRRSSTPYILAAAASILVIGTNVIPIGITIFDSLRENEAIKPDSHAFIWFENFAGVLSDPAFITAFFNTLGYVAIAVVGVLTIGLAFAMWLRKLKYAKALLLTVIVVPWAVPGTVNGQMWSLIFQPSKGLLTGVFNSLGIIHGDVNWLQGPGALPLIGLTLLWQALPIATLVMLSGLENIPHGIYEAANVDGATGYHGFWNITLPLLRPVLAITIVQTSFTAINFFDQIYVLNGDALGTRSIVQQTYMYAFDSLNFGWAFSATLIATAVTLLLCMGVVTFVYREVEL